MPHRRLCCPWLNASLAQVRSECVSQTIPREEYPVIVTMAKAVFGPVSIIRLDLLKLAPVDVAQAQRPFSGAVAMSLGVDVESGNLDQPVGNLV
jgi:hypothetical protein